MQSDLLLTRACWPVFLSVINLARQVRKKEQPDPKIVLDRMKSALREGNELAAADAAVHRAWSDRIRRTLIFFIDDKLVHLEGWNGRGWWREHRLETDPDGLDERRSEGGNRFYEECAALQKDYEQAERVNREDRLALAEQLGICFTCLRLGFHGEKRDAPEERREYIRRLYGLLPGQRTLTEEQLFPDAYKHTHNKDPLYPVGMSWLIVGSILGVLLLLTLGAYRFAWSGATSQIAQIAERFRIESASVAGVTTATPSATQPAATPPKSP